MNEKKKKVPNLDNHLPKISANIKHVEYQLPNDLMYNELRNRYIYRQYARMLHRIKYKLFLLRKANPRST